jgi:hypothetical protein
MTAIDGWSAEDERPVRQAVYHERGSLAAMIARLGKVAHDWEHLGKDKRRDAALDAIRGLLDGSCSVRVGVTTYSVE